MGIELPAISTIIIVVLFKFNAQLLQKLRKNAAVELYLPVVSICDAIY
jgi:hypothetical protein